MVLLKKVVNSNPGTADLVGGNDWDKLADYFNDIDTSEVPRINTLTEYRSGILKIRDGSNAFNVVMKSATQTANRDFTIPALIGNDSPAMLGISNSFTAVQEVRLDADTLLNLYRPVSTTNALAGLGFYERNSSNAPVIYSGIYNKLIANTAGDEDGKLLFYVKKDGVLTEVMSVDKNGLLTVASISVAPVAGITVLKNSGAVTTISNTVAETNMLNYTLPANTLGTNGSIKVRLAGYILQNDATGRAFQVKVKFGGTTIFDSITQSFAQQAATRPFVIEFVLRNANATNSQTGNGFMAAGLADVAATVGIGDINDDEVQVFSPFGFGTSSKDTTASQALLVTMTHAFAATTVQTVINGTEILLIPGV